MAEQKILLMGDNRLYEHAQAVSAFDTEELHGIVKLMTDTIEKNNAIALAAPQLGIAKRVIVFKVPEHLTVDEEPTIPLTVLVNPKITVLSHSKELRWEACKSLPMLCGAVNRFKEISYTGCDAHGKEITRTATGMHARIVQHEYDHLEGKLYISRVDNLHQLAYRDAFAQDNNDSAKHKKS